MKMEIMLIVAFAAISLILVTTTIRQAQAYDSLAVTAAEQAAQQGSAGKTTRSNLL